MTSVTEIVDMISSMMVAFVSISLVVSSIMIGVITYISVLERRKEIGILRAIGASKRNVSEVFNAETFIIGLCSGVMGIVLSEILLIPGNIHHPESLRHFDPRCSLPAGCSPLPRGTGYPAHHSGRHHPGPRRSQVQPRQSPARRVNSKNLIPGILSAPAAGIPGFFRLIFAPARRFSLYPSCMRTRFFALKVTKEYGRPGRF